MNGGTLNFNRIIYNVTLTSGPLGVNTKYTGQRSFVKAQNLNINTSGFLAELKKHVQGKFVQSKRVVLDLTDKTFTKLIQQEASVVLFTDKK